MERCGGLPYRSESVTVILQGGRAGDREKGSNSLGRAVIGTDGKVGILGARELETLAQAILGVVLTCGRENFAGSPIDSSDLVRRIAAMGFPWGESDGN